MTNSLQHPQPDYNNERPMKTLYHMDEWFKRPTGATLLELEHQHINALLKRTPGETVLQIGGPSDASLIEACPHALKCYYSFSGETTPGIPTIRGNLLQLPLQPDSLDLVVLAHTLAFSPTPRQCLEQLHHSLTAGGLMLILGFNPLSLLGMKRLSKNKDEFPHSGNYHLPWKVKYWLKQTQFSIIAYRTFGFYLPQHQQLSRNKLKFSENLGRLLLSGCGGIYMILAQKVDHGMTPLALNWWERSESVETGFKPTSLEQHQK